MRPDVAVCGLWHLGMVTAACLAQHSSVVAYDPDRDRVRMLMDGEPPVSEPGLADLLKAGLASNRLSFTTERERAATAALVWITYDVPIDSDDVPDLEFLRQEISSLTRHLAGQLVMISSQVPVGFTAWAEADCRAQGREDVRFAYSPENLRLGAALDAFRSPDRVVVGIRGSEDRSLLASLFAPFCSQVEWMGVESAELAKHAINAFLATSIAFANELAALAEQVGADAAEVERALKTERRIGPRAYLRPGAAPAGGTLNRDVASLTAMAAQRGLPLSLIESVKTSNRAHEEWPLRKLEQALGSVAGTSVGVLGLTYKVGTDTLRRSSAVELCEALSRRGARVRAFDPAVHHLPPELRGVLDLAPDAQSAWRGANALVLATEWPAFREIPADSLAAEMSGRVIVDASGFLRGSLGTDQRFDYYRVGSPPKR